MNTGPNSGEKQWASLGSMNKRWEKKKKNEMLDSHYHRTTRKKKDTEPFTQLSPSQGEGTQIGLTSMK